MPSPTLKWLRRLQHILGIDRAIAFTVMARGWTILAGPVNILLIAHFLSPVEQGYYYTFSSLVALQTIFELGFSFVILQLAAHESAHLCIEPDGRISGDEIAHSRLASILQKSVRWYTVAAILMAAGLLTTGHLFFASHQRPSESVAWSAPWTVISLAATLTFQMDPVLSFLEGCGLVSNVAHLRFAQAVMGSLLAWTVFLLHHGLFAPAALITGQAFAGIVFLYGKRHLLVPLLRKQTSEAKVSWTKEIWPFQWKIAVSWICSYFVAPLFNPVLFAYRGAAEAGRMGMSLTLAGALGPMAFSWMATKASPFGNLVARQDFASLDRIFSRALRQSLGILFAGEVLLLAFIVLLERLLPSFGTRVLSIPALLLLLATTLCTHVLFCEAIYLRVHKREPLLVQSVVVAILTCISTLVTARYWGAFGVSLGYFVSAGVIGLVFATLVFNSKRREWHGSSLEFPRV